MTEPDKEIWMADLDGTGSMHPASQGDPGAISYTRTDTLPTWQPIETAPRDGRGILVTFHNQSEEKEECGWVTHIADACEHEFEGAGWGHSRNVTFFTHWMPLPTPPKGN